MAASVLVVTTACGADTPEDPVTVTVTQSSEAAPPPETTEPEPPTTPEPEVAAPAPAEEATFTMPALAGVNLQDAQDLLQTLDSYVMDQVDATGLERFAVDDSNWVVCSQDPAPGAVVATSTVVTLAAVKLDEACP
ncbi:PASTA domain-containing protein [Oerskovia merdavium]|uniref:PASTA domain-containing protein n=1 Tax=Oerskovia merdavium TaxID=2762227 RepID=A0ABR8U0K7_9CELL|nr:PASTA domain-containing protein [Oerskovia merdavium]MBD7981557.1 hypothetical protein [Oerskovia merdavium]